MHAGKGRLRREVLARLERLTRTGRLAKSRAIRARLFGLRVFQRAKVVQFYCSVRSEVRTDEMIAQALAIGKRVAVPVTPPDGRLRLREVTDPVQDLVPGRFQIPEPVARSTRPIALRRVEVAVIPGIAFDKEGHRLGRGAGHFDRFLAGRPPGPGDSLSIVALAYDAQIVRQVPVTGTDIPVDLIVTETRVIRCRRDRQGRKGHHVGAAA